MKRKTQWLGEMGLLHVAVCKGGVRGAAEAIGPREAPLQLPP